MRLHLTVEELADGTSKVLYAGQEVLLAEKAVAESVNRGEAIRVDRFFNPAPCSIRYPVAEKDSAAQRQIAQKAAAEIETNAKVNEAQKKREEAKRLNAEAKRIEAEIKS